MKMPKQGQPVRLQLPFRLRGDIGLGDAIKRLTAALGMKVCGTCEQRAAALNRHFVLTGRRPR